MQAMERRQCPARRARDQPEQAGDPLDDVRIRLAPVLAVVRLRRDSRERLGLGDGDPQRVERRRYVAHDRPRCRSSSSPARIAALTASLAASRRYETWSRRRVRLSLDVPPPLHSWTISSSAVTIIASARATL